KLQRREWAGVFAVALILLVAGIHLQWAAASRPRHWHTDLGDYLRAAWAVRTGGDPYSTVDLNGWHYNYPPLLAILTAPIADPPDAPADQQWSTAGHWTLPWAVVVPFWYLLSVAALLW